MFGEHLPISHSSQPSCQVPAFKYLLCSRNHIKPCSPLSPSLPPDSPLPGMCSDVTASLTKKKQPEGSFFYFSNCCDCCFLSASPKQTLSNLVCFTTLLLLLALHQHCCQDPVHGGMDFVSPAAPWGWVPLIGTASTGLETTLRPICGWCNAPSV